MYRMYETELQDDSVGILGTSVTWANFENHLRKALGTKARLGGNKSVTDIGEGNGFVSCCGLIHCDWVGAAIDEKLPSSVVLKIPSFLPTKKAMDALPPEQRLVEYDEEKWATMDNELKEVHNTEMATYDYLDEFSGLAVPRRYYAVPIGAEHAGQICLEYLPNSRNMYYYETNSVETMRQIAIALGKIRAHSLTKRATAPEMRKDYFQTVIKMHPLEAYQSLFKGLLTIDRSLKALLAKIEFLLSKYYEMDLVPMLLKKHGITPMLFSGDAHTGNVLIDKDSGDFLALIDWQSAHFGCGVEDLHRFMLSALSAEDRRASTPMILEAMHRSLVENLDGAEAPYSLKTLILISDTLFPAYGVFFIAGFIQKLVNLENDPNISEKEKEERKAIVLEKVIGALEDVVALDAKMKKHLEKF